MREQQLESRRFALCLTDMRLPDGDGLDLLDWMPTHCRRVPGAVITAHGNVESAVHALKLGAFDFVSKPLDLGLCGASSRRRSNFRRPAMPAAPTRGGTQLTATDPRWNDCER